MTTVATTAVIGNPRMSRIFSATSTDGIYNNQNDSVTSTAIGLSMPNQTITYIQASQATGLGIWRIMSSTTNQIYRQGFTSKTGYTCPASNMIVPLAIQSDMLFQVYTLADDATANQSNALALITSNRGVEAFYATDIADSTATELKSLLSGLGIGDLLFGATISQVAVQGEAGMALTSISVLDAASGTQYSGYGSTRLPTAGGKSAMTNGVFNVSIPLQKGFVLKATTVTA
jgi:hypothetical protein